MGNKLYVGNLAYSVRDESLQAAFAQFGTVTSAKVMMDRETGRSKGFGFVEMSSAVEAQAAINAMNGQPLEGRAVVVNEAAACGLPLVLSDRVGAAHDLLRDGENGFLVAAGDVEAASGALRRLAADGDLRSAQGARSRELARDWGYGPSVEGFLAAVREAVA